MPTTYAIPNGATVFNISLSNTGTTSGPGAGVAKVISGLAFQPDMVWSKNRSSSANARWGVIDSVRGVNKTLSQNNTFAEVTSQTDLLTAFNSNGVNIGADAAGYGWNWNQQSGASDNYAYWLWNAGSGTTSSNTNGSITSTVSVNATAGFSIVVYTGNGTNGATVGHGLGVKPSLIIEKGRSTTYNWSVQGCGVLWSDVTKTLFLNGTSGLNAGSGVAAPTSSVFTPSATLYANENGVSNVAYCWAAVPGYSAFGSYTGNGSTDGPFVYLGFRPRFLLLKVSSTTGDWVIYDTSRNTYNVMDLYLYPDSSAAEGGSGTPRVDVLSNGFKLRNSGQDNTSGATYIYAAFAENPFKYANAR